MFVSVINLTFKKTKNMNKEELIESIANGAKLTKADAGRVLDATIENIEKALKKGDRVALVGFGSFSVAKRAARTGRNPQTGKAIKIAAKKVVKFKAGSDLASSVNKGK
jgi:DNA-binding protein HU-beta